MKKRGERRFWLLVGTLALLGAASAAFVCLTREPLLIEQAVKAADTQDWDFRWTSYRWITNSEVLFFRDSTPQYPTQNGWNLFKRDIIANQEAHLPGLTRLADETLGKHSQLDVSPDGKRLFWTDEEGALFYSSTLDGKQFRRYQRGRESRIRWTGDSLHLVEYVMDADLNHSVYGLLHDVASVEPARKLAKPGIFSGDEAFVSTRDHVLTTSWTGKYESDTPTGTVDVFEWVLREEAHPKQAHIVPLPERAEVWDEKFSPQGDRVLWPLVQEAVPLQPPLAWLHRWLPKLVPEPRPSMRLWVSRTDGRRMHEIGYVPLKTGEYGLDTDGIPRHIYWLPDGKRISFLLKDALYIVPAD